MTKAGDLSTRQNHYLQYVARYETRDFGVIVPTVTAQALIYKGYAIDAPRRVFARDGGTCIRLTSKGKEWNGR